jgi:hypothetical protein
MKHAHPVTRKAIARVILVVAALSFMALFQGCKLLRAPGKAVHAITPGPKAPKMDPAEVATLVQRLADENILRTGQALDAYARIRGTPEAASEALRWKAVLFAYSMRIAGGYNPYGSLVDMVALVSFNRNALEDYWVHTPQGAAFQPWLDSSREFETNVWQAAKAAFRPEQLDALRKAIEDYRRTHASVKYPLFIQPLEFTAELKGTTSRSEEQSSILGFVGLDPTIGLDPAIQEVTRTRLFAERSMFTVQRMPTMMRLQAEILMDNFLRQAEMQQTLTNTTRLAESADRISRAVESVSQTAALMPDRLSQERAAILKDLEQQEGKLRDLTSEVGRSLAEAEKMSSALTITITNVDALMKRFGVGESKTNQAPATNAEPFKILDYAETAARIGDMARDLNTLIASVDQAAPQVAQLSAQTTIEARKLVNHSFRLGLVLIGALLIGAVAAGLLYRILARRLVDGRRPHPSPNSP